MSLSNMNFRNLGEFSYGSIVLLQHLCYFPSIVCGMVVVSEWNLRPPRLMTTRINLSYLFVLYATMSQPKNKLQPMVPASLFSIMKFQVFSNPPATNS